jgi:hypothetical protein
MPFWPFRRKHRHFSDDPTTAVGHDKSPRHPIASRPAGAYFFGGSASLLTGGLVIRQILALVIRKQPLPLDEMEKVVGHFGLAFAPVVGSTPPTFDCS